MNFKYTLIIKYSIVYKSLLALFRLVLVHPILFSTGRYIYTVYSLLISAKNLMNPPTEATKICFARELKRTWQRILRWRTLTRLGFPLSRRGVFSPAAATSPFTVNSKRKKFRSSVIESTYHRLSIQRSRSKT